MLLNVWVGTLVAWLCTTLCSMQAARTPCHIRVPHAWSTCQRPRRRAPHACQYHALLQHADCTEILSGITTAQTVQEIWATAHLACPARDR